jgi:hypothetical protein
MAHVLVTLGRNPLPVAIAVSRLFEEYKGSQFTVLASTFQDIDRLVEAVRIKHPTFDCQRDTIIDYTDPKSIWERGTPFAADHQNEEVHFHYTGGTKPMILHMKSALDAGLKHPPSVSYIAADQHYLEICSRTAGGALNVQKPVADERQHFILNLDQLSKLHGFSRNFTVLNQRGRYEVGAGLRVNGFLPNERTVGNAAWLELAREMFQLRSCYTNRKVWDTLLNGFNKWLPKNYSMLPNPLACEPIPWPMDLPAELTDQMNALLGKQVWDISRTFQPQLVNDVQLEQVARWFKGDWLEDLVFDAFSKELPDVSRSLGVRFALIDPNYPTAPVRKDFELDVAVIFGYQLIVASCYGGTKAHEAKMKGFEVLHRAQQLGGSEALAILVCLLHDDDADDLAEELNATAKTFNTRFRIWNRNDVTKLNAKIVELLNSVSYY